MVFSSLSFIFLFLPLFLLSYYVVPSKWENAILFVGSMIFYTVGVLDQPIYLALFFLSIGVNYLLANRMELEHNRRRRRLILMFGLFFDFIWLFLFKYSDFIFSGLNEIFKICFPSSDVQIPQLGLILPLGISFYTFQIVSYLVDVYHRKNRAEKSLITFGAYISMFPQLIAGPIVNYSSVSDQLHKDRRFSISQLSEGLKLFIVGLGLKVLLANQVGNLWTSIQAIGYDSISTQLAWLGIFGYSFQIYFDFWGYSLMAIGLGHMLGIKLPMNFNHPYTSRSMTEFWRRWHITLGEWFRDYLYIPLGGNRVPWIKWVRNLFLVWAFTGLWHGAGWNFILWGVFLFAVMLIEKLGLKKFLDRFPWIGHLYMIFLIPISWVFFAITDFSQMTLYFSRLFPWMSSSYSVIFQDDYIKYAYEFCYVLLAGLLFSTKIPSKIYYRIKDSIPGFLILLLIFWGAIYCLYIGLNDPFLYFRF